jgi:hypothetical protein
MPLGVGVLAFLNANSAIASKAGVLPEGEVVTGAGDVGGLGETPIIAEFRLKTTGVLFLRLPNISDTP